MTNYTNIVCQIVVLDTVISDHKLVLVGTYIEPKSKSEPEYPETSGFAKLNFNHNMIEWNEIDAELLQVDWLSQFNGKSPAEMLEIIDDYLLDICTKYIPKKGGSKNKSNIPRDRKILMRKRTKINHQLIKANSIKKTILEEKLNVLEYKLVNSHKMEENENEMRAVNAIKLNSKYFFAYAKKKSMSLSQ